MGRRRVGEWITHSASETVDLGSKIAKRLEKNSILCFFGDLAAGKTTLIKGIVQKITGVKAEAVSSPTFVYLNIYNGPINVYHFDLYRLNNSSDFLTQGFDEYLSAGGICCIEWSERVEGILAQNHVAIHIKHLGKDRRKITVRNETTDEYRYRKNHPRQL